MNHLVLGHLGEVGSAIHELLQGAHQAHGYDVREPAHVLDPDVLHVCIPWSEDFLDTVRAFPARLVIVHSTVPVGTTEQIGAHAVHSPIRGVHPDLHTALRLLTKFFGGPCADMAAQIFRDLGVPAITTPLARTTEALKLWSTTQYGVSIVVQKAIRRFCDEHGLDYQLVYDVANYSYNEGYKRLGMDHVRRPILRDMPGPIGGHCVIPNARLLDDDVARFVLREDRKAK